MEICCLELRDNADGFYEWLSIETHFRSHGGLVIILVLAYSIFALVCPEESIAPSSLSAPN